MFIDSYNEEHRARRARLGIVEPKPVAKRKIAPPLPRPEKEVIKDTMRDIIWVTNLPHMDFLPNLPNVEAEQEEVRAEAWKRILREVSTKTFIPVSDIVSRSRAKPVTKARQEACYRMVNELGMSYPAVARRVGFINHTSALYAVREYAKRYELNISKDPEMRVLVRARDAEIVRNVLLGETPEELAQRYELSSARVKGVIIESAKKLAGRAVKKILQPYEKEETN